MIEKIHNLFMGLFYKFLKYVKEINKINQVHIRNEIL